MASYAIQRRRGTAAEHGSITGLAGELTVNTTRNSIHVHDASTAGGHELAKADLSNLTTTALNGSLLIDKVSFKLKEENINLIWCNSRINVIDFYKKNKFKEIGKKFSINLLGDHKKLIRKL